MQETKFVLKERKMDPQRLDARLIFGSSTKNGEDIVRPGRKLLKG